MFASHAIKSLPDLSFDISNPVDWQAGLLRTVQYHVDITTVAIEPTSGLFAVGTSRGVIYVYGSPGVECELRVDDPPGLRIKFIQFAASAFKLLCIDEHNRLHVWDLTTVGKPSLERITGLGQPVNALVTSPSHTHAFIALANGGIKTFDLLCLRLSHYVIPNLWTIHEERSLAIADGPPLDMVIDVVIHPRDLNLLFVAYEGGVILSDLKEQKPVRTFSLTLSPGAPGGSGYHSKDVLLPRQLQVTALAVHPSGHLLAIGYVDGTIGFWSLEDEDKPLLLRTIDSENGEDLSAVDTAKLESILSTPPDHAPEPPREPIYKLTWSGFPNSPDPRGGDTILTALGGITLDSPPCVTTLLLPPLRPPAPQSPSSPSGQPIVPTLVPEIRAAIVASLSVKNSYTYNAAGTVQDFLLFARNSPHFAGTYDPSTILIISESDAPDARVSEAFEFPPPAFVEHPEPPTGQTKAPAPVPAQAGDPLEPDDGLVDELEMTLRSMSMSDDPRPARLPPYLWSVLGEYLVNLDKHAHETLVRDKLDPMGGEVPFPAKGGLAWAEDIEGHMKYLKQQPHRILVTHLRDLSIHFSDLAARLLNSTGPDTPIATSFPSPIPRLTIELAPILLDPSLGLADDTAYDPHLTNQHIDAVHLAPESLECLTVLRSGAVILHRLDVPATTNSFGQKTFEDKELVSLAHLHVRNGLRYSPAFAIKPDKSRGQVSSCVLSDVGFLAVAYTSGLLFVVDLRVPRVILRSETRPEGSSFFNRHSQVEPIQTLSWVCCGLATDPQARVRLFGTTASGQTTIYTLEYAPPSTWKISAHPVVLDGSSHPVPSGSFVLDAKTGKQCRADRNGLASVLQSEHSTERQYLWLSAGAKGVRTVLNVNGERVAKVDWGSKVGTVLHVEIVGRLDSHALVAYTSHGLALVYSLPHLEHIHTLQLRPDGFSDPPATEVSGDFLTHTTLSAPSRSSSSRLITSTELRTHFNVRRAGPYAHPLVDLAHGRGTVPSQPQPVSLGPPSVMNSVLGYLGSLSVTSAGDQIDTLLAGPNRPVPPLTPKTRPPPASISDTTPIGLPSQSSKAAGAASGVSDLYNRLGTALTERGEMLGDLQQSMNSLEEGSKNMVAQAKKLAAQQAAKGWFGF